MLQIYNKKPTLVPQNDMEHYKVEYLNDTIRLRITTSPKPGCVTTALGATASVIILLPIVVGLLILDEITFGFILTVLLSWLIASYFVRMFLWNKYGEEVFIIQGKTMESYNDYKLFKDNRKTISFNKMHVLYFVDDEWFYASEWKRIKNMNENQLSELGFLINKEVITSHRQIPVADIIKISSELGANKRFII